MSTSDNCKDGSSTKSNNDSVCAVNDKLQNMSLGATVSICANCGKEGNEINNVCNKCKMVKYCNAACKKKHRHKHKKECERFVAELHDEKLFKQPPPNEDCPICFLRIPTLHPTGSSYYECCGKVLCSGCSYAPLYDDQGNRVDNQKCPFCRLLTPDSVEENVQRYKKRIEADDPIAMYNLGSYYFDGSYGFTQDYDKALELYRRSAELGYAGAYCSIGSAYYNGEGVEVDKKKAEHYYELAAIEGHVIARVNLGNEEVRSGNMDRALKHYMIAVGCGDHHSLKQIQQFYGYGRATKEDYTAALRSYQEYLSEIKSKQRDEAAAAHDQYRYYESG